MSARFLVSVVAFIGLSLAAPHVFAAEINVYSARKEALIKPLLVSFTEETGIKVNLLTAKADALLKRLSSEGMHSPADLLITTDAGRLSRAKNAGVLQQVRSELLNKNIPQHLRDPEGYWFGLSVRARVIVYVKDKVGAHELSTYQALADPKWKRRICIRSSGNIYNQSMVASMIASDGVETTQAWANRFVESFARPPKGGDRDQVKAAAIGQCDLAVVNTYYLGKMLNSRDKKQRQAANKVAVFWPDQQGRGTHINVSGIGLTQSSKNKAAAIKLMEYLSADKAQFWYAMNNFEYPVKAGIDWSETLKNWGKFNSDNINLAKLGEFNPEAVRLMDRAGWK
jgi:iron(III) transport system substrate-binding protein